MARFHLHVGLVAALLPAVACVQPPKAPADLDGATTFLFRQWNNSDSSVMESGVDSLYNFLQPIAARGDLTGDLQGRSWQPTPAQQSDLGDIPWPSGKNVANCIGAAVAWKSPWSIADHAQWQTQANQVPAEPTASSYTRTFTDPTNPGCFIDRSCTVMDTSDDVTRVNPLGSVRFQMFKDFRWVRLQTEGGASWAFVARSWMPQSANGNTAGTAILQSYAVDVWLSISDTETWRYQASFSQSTPALATSIMVSILADGVDENLQGDDKAIKGMLGE